MSSCVYTMFSPLQNIGDFEGYKTSIVQQPVLRHANMNHKGTEAKNRGEKNQEHGGKTALVLAVLIDWISSRGFV